VTVHLTFDDIVALAGDAVAPAEVVIRDFGLLQAAIARPQATAFGTEAYPTLFGKAAALMESLARNHALIDGNKRLSWLATMVFCLLNDVVVTPPGVDEAEQFVLAVCQGKLSLDEIAQTLLSWS